MKAGLYRDVSPVTLHLDDAVLTASLYCSSVQGLAGAAEEALLESFLVEVFRCRLCLFASGHQSRVLTHLLHRHHVAAPRNAASSQTHPGLQVQSPYSLEDPDLEDPDLEDPDLEDPDLVDPDLEDPDLEDQDLSSASKAPSDEDSLGLERISFLLPMYGMLPNISPRSCDIGLGSQSHGGLHVAQTCEVSTLLEEVEEEACHDGGGHAHMLALPGNHDDQSAQSAHLMTLGLCRISAPPPALKARSPAHSPEPPPPPPSPCPVAPRRRSTASAQRRAASHRTDRRTGTDRHLKKRRKERERGRERRKRHAATVQSRDRLHKHFTSKHKASADKQKVAPPCGLEGRTPAKRIPEGAVLQKDSRGATEGWGRCRNTHTVKSRGRRDGGEDERIDTTEEERGGRLGDFCCSLCSRKFVSKLTLRRHMGIHQGEKPFHCPHCHYNTRLKASLVQHIRTHTGEKPFRCSQCSYASIDRSSLRRHSRTHSQEKPYRCTHCTYSSIQKKSLDLHARRHHTGESFPCQQCAYSSPDRQLLLRHVRKNHNSQHATGQRGQRSPQPLDS